MDKNKVIFITQSPCKMCAKMIVNSGASHVYYFSKYRSAEGLDVLAKGKIAISRMSL